jgi:uncharacterized protein YjaG (DUF416 family)
MLLFSREILDRKLRSLSNKKRLAFALLLCERQFALLEAFGVATGFDYAEYRKYIDLAWTVFETDARDVPNVDFCELEDTCLDHAPDTEDFSHQLTSAALNCTLSIGHLMGELCRSGEDDISEVAQLAYDTVHMWAQVHDGMSYTVRGISDDIIGESVVQVELEKQDRDLKFLETNLDVEQPDQVNAFRRMARSQDPILPF